jgi:integrase
MSKQRGVYEKFSGSGEWWVRYVDGVGRLRREKAGTWSTARDLYIKRKQEALARKKLPEKLRKRVVMFSELCDDALEYTKANNEGYQNDGYRIEQLRAEFGGLPAESIPIGVFRSYFDGQKRKDGKIKTWKDGTFNRIRTVLFSIYRLGIENEKVSVNPAKLLKRKKVSDGRVRFLNQFEPLPTKVAYLKPHKTEEARLRAVIERDFPENLEQFIIALNTGMRSKEQFVRVDWPCVDLVRKDLAIPKSKNGDGRHIRLTDAARTAFESLRQRCVGKGAVPIRVEGPVFVGKGQKRLLSARHWYPRAVKKAGISHFTWHDLRHTFASRLVMEGVDIVTVSRLLGHKSLAMTMRYSHLSPQHEQVAIERLNRYNF